MIAGVLFAVACVGGGTVGALVFIGCGSLVRRWRERRWLALRGHVERCADCRKGARAVACAADFGASGMCDAGSALYRRWLASEHSGYLFPGPTPQNHPAQGGRTGDL